MVDMQNAGHIRYHEKAGKIQSQAQARNSDKPLGPGTAPQFREICCHTPFFSSLTRSESLEGDKFSHASCDKSAKRSLTAFY